MTMALMTLLQAAPTPPAGTNPSAPNASMFLFPALVVGMIVFMMVMQRGQTKKTEAKKRALLDGLAKNDRVLTIGGVIGTVTSVRDQEVVVKVDESTNTKMVFLKRAIQQKIQDDETPRLDER